MALSPLNEWRVSKGRSPDDIEVFEAKQRQARGRAAMRLHRSAKKRALHHGILYELTPEIIEAALEVAGDQCAVSGMVFSYEGKAEGFRNRSRPSLDRIDPAKGYTMHNVRIVTVQVNVAINEWGLEDFYLLCECVGAERDMHSRPMSIGAIRDRLLLMRIVGRSENLRAFCKPNSALADR